ncbi:MAG: hypothetical protein D6727_11875 [Gammaproteobacteria bacterium]|nr:MAG: hypothetical protein D6727_11875 [Gammaproteobacteria bacterium]
MAADMSEMDIRMDRNGLYREEVFTDRRVGTIQRLTPVDADGQADPARAVIYVGQAQLMTRAGPLPLSFEIPAASLSEAVDRFADSANAAVNEAMQRLEEIRREAASSIIVPGSEGAGGGGVPGGGVPGGGIQMR